MAETPIKGFYQSNETDTKRTTITETANTMQKIEDNFLQVEDKLIVQSGNVVYVENFPVITPESNDAPRIQRAIDYAKSSGAKAVVFALKIYNTNTTLKVYSGIVLIGQHKTDTKIISQGDIPTIASEGYFTPGVGGSDIFISTMGIYPRGVTSKTKYAVEMVNTYNTHVRDCYINESNMTTADVGGIRFSKDSAYTGAHFVNSVSNCQLQNASIVMESTDSYISKTEVWADKRSFAIHLAKSSQFLSDLQVVGSAVKGAIWIEDTKDGFDIEMIRMNNVYFDGSYDAIDTGIGLYAVKMRLSRIQGEFWRNKDEGIKMINCHSNTIIGSVFTNNNRRDLSKDDIYMDGCAANTIIGNTFKRDVSHTSKGRPFRSVNSDANRNLFIGNTLYYTSNYLPASVSNRDLIRNNAGMADNIQRTHVRAHLTNGFSSVIGAETKLIFDTETNDIVGEYSPTTGRFTAAEAGVYSISAMVALNGQSTTVSNRGILFIWKNGVSTWKLCEASNGLLANTGLSGTTTVQLSPGDYIEIYYYSSGTSAITGGSNGKETHLTISRIQ